MKFTNKMKTIGLDFQGWPIQAHTLGEILLHLGFKKDGDNLVINLSNPLLDAYPLLLEDDGMGYGVNPQLVVEADKEIYEQEITTTTYDYEQTEDETKRPKVVEKREKEKINVFNLFRDLVMTSDDTDGE